MSSKQIETTPKPKKKKKCPDNWRKNKAKKSRKTGHEYTSLKTG
jgi:hypothetical protein